MVKRKLPLVGLFPAFVCAALLLVIVFQNRVAKANEPAKSSAPTARKYLISIDTLIRENQTAGWSQGLCAWVHESLTVLSAAEPASKCVSFAVDEEAEKKVRGLSIIGNFEYRIHLSELTDGSLDVQVINWRRDRLESDFERVGWKIAPGTPTVQSNLLFKILRRIVEFHQNERALKEFAMAAGIRESTSIRMDSEGIYYDVETSQVLKFDEAYARFERESDRTRNFLRATSEVGVMLGLGALLYYKGHVMGAEDDFDVPGSWAETIEKKLRNGQNIRFDSNDPGMNVGHAFAGALYYHAARTGGFSSFESFLMALVSSTLWEYLSEFHEKVSINDQIITPVGGAAIGEALFQFGDFFHRGGNSLPNRILTGIFGSLQKFDYWIDGQKLPRAKNLDKYGFNADVMHQFDVWAGVAHLESKDTSAGTGGTLGWDMTIIKAPGYGKEGKGREFLKDTVMTQFMVNLVSQKSGLQEFEFLMKSVFAGYYKQDIRKDGDDQLDGYSFLIGPASAFGMRSLPTQEGEKGDWQAVVNVLGATVDVVAYKKGTKLRMTMDVYGDFAMVRSLAFDDYSKENSVEGMKNILARGANGGNGYYYGVGVTTAGSATLSRGNWELGVEGKYRAYDSVEGYERYQEEVTKDFDHYDSIGSVKVKFSHPFFVKNAKLTYSAERIRHRSEMGPVSRTQRYNEIMGRLVFTF